MQGKGRHIDKFYFPGKSIGWIPIENDGRLGFSMIEVGCKPRGKRSQLKSKREQLFEYWTDFYSDVGWYPEIFRVVAHYQPYRPVFGCDPEFLADRVIVCEYIGKEILLELDERDKNQLRHIFQKRSRIKDRLIDIVEKGESDRLHSIIANYDGQPELGHFRGKIAEIVFQKHLYKCKPKGIRMYRNGDISYFNKVDGQDKYYDRSEVDAIGTFYATETFYQWIDNLSKVDGLRVEKDLLEVMLENKAELPN